MREAPPSAPPWGRTHIRAVSLGPAFYLLSILKIIFIWLRGALVAAPLIFVEESLVAAHAF